MGNITKAMGKNISEQSHDLLEKQVNQTLSIKEDLTVLDTDEEFSNDPEESEEENLQENRNSSRILLKKIGKLDKKLFLNFEEKQLKRALESIISLDSFYPKKIYCSSRDSFSVKFKEMLSPVLKNGKQQEIAAFYYKIKQNLAFYQSQVPDLAERMNQFGGKFLNLNNYTLSEQCFKYALNQIQKKGEKEADYANILNNYGVLLKKTNKIYSAFECYNESLKTLERISGTRTSQYADVLYNMALMLEDMGKREESIDKLYQNLSINEECSGKMSIRCVDSCHKIGVALFQDGREQEAVHYLRRCYLILYRYEETTSKRFKINKSYLQRMLGRNNIKK